MNKRTLFLIILGITLSIACTCLPVAFSQQTAEIAPPPEPKPQEGISPVPTLPPTLGEIIFCTDVTDDGIPINPTDDFPAGTENVFAYFTYENMQDGTPWGRLWQSEGEIWLDVRDDIWEDGESGWVAYSVTGDLDRPLSGNYTLTLSLGDQIVQEGAFSVDTEPLEVSPGLSAFGAIQFATGITDDRVPYGVANEFEEGITKVYAVFAFFNMQDGQAFRFEWLRDGDIVGARDVEWYEGSHGFDYTFFRDEDGLKPGDYTLNLYIDGQIARSAGFNIYTVQPALREPALPHEIIDEYMMPAWLNLAHSEEKLLRDLAEFALNNHVNIYVDPNLEHLATYRYTCALPYVSGEIIISLRFWKESSWEETTAALAHELVHAFQHKSGDYPCGCTIEKEYYAWIAELFVLQEMGRKDIISEKFSAAYDSRTGQFDSDKLWELLKRVYPNCPEY